MKRVKHPLDKHQWIAYPSSKQYIVWHGTGHRTKFTPYSGLAGSPVHVINNWNNDGEKSGAPYIVDRNGTVFEVFPDTDWAHHLHINSSNGHYDKHSVAIEIANELGLTKKDGLLYAFNSTYHQNAYLGKAWDKDYRGYNHWAELNIAQVDSLIELTLELCKKFKITPRFYNSDEFDPAVWDKATIFRHLNCRKDKTDLPLNDWVIDKIRDAGIELVT